MENKSGKCQNKMNNFKNCTANLLSSIDFIGRKPKLKLNLKPRNQTVMGGILCILMFAIFIPSALYFGQELVFHVLPKIIESSIPLDESDYINISKNAFSFYLYLRDGKGQLYSTDGYIDLSLQIISVAHNENPYEVEYSSKNVTMKTCEKGDIPEIKDNENYISSEYLNKLKCIQEKPDTIIQGTNSHKKFSFLQLTIKKCQPDIGKTCFASKDIDEKLKRSLVVLKYYDIEYNQREFNDFSNLHIKEQTFSLNNQLDKDVFVTIKKTEFYTDVGYMFEDFKLKSFHNIVSFKTESFASEENNFKMNMIFIIDYSKSVNYRKYYKFQNWVAELGGIVKAISIIATVINYFNDKSSYYQLMINKLFDVDDVIKYYQYFDSDNDSTKVKKRDSIVLLNAKKEKDYFEKEGLNRLGTEKHSFSNQFHSNNNVFKKYSNNRITSSMSKNELELNNEHKNSSLHNNNSTNPNPNLNANTNNINNNKILNSNNELINMVNNNNTLNNNTNSNFNIINQNNTIDQLNRLNQLNLPRNNIHQSNLNTSDIDPHEIYIMNLKKSKTTKEHFEKKKKDRFSLNMFEQVVFFFCHKKDNPKFNALLGGNQLITERSDIIYILRKNLEFDRLKNLILKDNQMLLLNSLTKFMLDPERVNLIDFHHCNYDKFIDSYYEVTSGPDMIDIKLSKWVETKFKFDHLLNSNLR